jgi:hypothetical protein
MIIIIFKNLVEASSSNFSFSHLFIWSTSKHLSEIMKEPILKSFFTLKLIYAYSICWFLICLLLNLIEYFIMDGYVITEFQDTISWVLKTVLNRFMYTFLWFLHEFCEILIVIFMSVFIEDKVRSFGQLKHVFKMK